MTREQAIQLLDQTVAQMALPRAQHQMLVQALQVLAQEKKGS